MTTIRSKVNPWDMTWVEKPGGVTCSPNVCACPVAIWVEKEAQIWPTSGGGGVAAGGVFGEMGFEGPGGRLGTFGVLPVGVWVQGLGSRVEVKFAGP